MIALHNIHSDELEKVLELGGLAMPSLAITKYNKLHSGFGDITLIFSKETIDPKADSKNKVYGGDAYTPMFPRVIYDVNEDVVQRIRDKYYELDKKYGDKTARPLYNYIDKENARDYLEGKTESAE